MYKVLNLVFCFVSILGVLNTNSKARAASFNLDFDTDAQGNALNAQELDTHLPGERVDVGSLWQSIGIDISGDSKAPLGLFQTECLPSGSGAVSNNGFTTPCESGGDGDNDLATGDGQYKDIVYDTIPQGNALIFEENPGNGVPDDIAKGGTITFDFDRTFLSSVKLGEIGIIDDASGTIVVNFLDGTKFTQSITSTEENDLRFFTVPDKQIANFSVEFNGSGAISGVAFTEFTAIPEINEPSTILGVATVVALGTGLKRKKSQKN
ncbi:MAG: PEP-CTERM sorting domain-containing protein [Cyanobacteria bacterium P01_G01_bin.49]